MNKDRYRVFAIEFVMNNTGNFSFLGKYNNFDEAKKSFSTFNAFANMQKIIVDYGPMRDDGQYSDKGKIVHFN